MADISHYHAGDRFKIVVPNAKSIPLGTIVCYTGENKRCCGGTFKMICTSADSSEEFWCFDHWLQKVS